MPRPAIATTASGNCRGLNGILALKELGLSLEQIGPLLKDEISATEVARHAHAEAGGGGAFAARGGGRGCGHIESRIAQIDRLGGTEGFDVILKSVEPTPFLSLHCSCADMDEVVRMVRLVAEDGARQIRPALRDRLVVVARNDHDDDKLDLEIGFSLTRPSNAGVRLPATICCAPANCRRSRPWRPWSGRAPTWKATRRSARSASGSKPTTTRLPGPCREVFLEPITGPPGFEGALVEIQFPIRPAA
jgi:hypothetical protein